MNECSACGRLLEAEERFCSACGMPVAADQAPRCRHCGRELKQWARFCGGCGRPVEESESVPATPVSASPDTPAAARAPTAVAPRAVPAAQAPHPDTIRRSPAIVLGVVLAVLGGFLPWVSLLDVRATAWQLSVNGLLLGRGLGRGPAVMLVLLASLLALVVLRRGFVFAVGGADVLLAGFALIRAYTLQPRLSPGIGLFVSAAGGLLLVASSFAAPAAPRHPLGQPASPPVPEPEPPEDDIEYVRPLRHEPEPAAPEPTPTASVGESSSDADQAGWTIPERPDGTRRCPECGQAGAGLYCSRCGSRID